MSESFTYETEEKQVLETYEWDNIWWEHADDTKKDRILIIGDSISCGYRNIINKKLSGSLYVDGIGTSKNLANDSFIALIEYVFSQKENYKIVQFNNGLHGWNLSKEEYELHYEKVIKHIQKEYPTVKIIIALTTPLRNKNDFSKMDNRNKIVIDRNESARKIADKYGFEVNDLYSVIKNRNDIYREDGVHLTDEGYEILAQNCVDQFTKYI